MICSLSIPCCTNYKQASICLNVPLLLQNLCCVRKASQESQQSSRLARVLEMVLAMGNYMNKGNARVGQASGFKVAFLAQVDR